jgi:hypothetical protein
MYGEWGGGLRGTCHQIYWYTGNSVSRFGMAWSLGFHVRIWAHPSTHILCNEFSNAYLFARHYLGPDGNVGAASLIKGRCLLPWPLPNLPHILQSIQTLPTLAAKCTHLLLPLHLPLLLCAPCTTTTTIPLRCLPWIHLWTVKQRPTTACSSAWDKGNPSVAIAACAGAMHQIALSSNLSVRIL